MMAKETRDRLGNLYCPDLACFRHLQERVIPGIAFGRPELCDWADKSPDDPVCGGMPGFWNHEEAALLRAIAGSAGYRWLDIGAHTGWTAANIASMRRFVIAVEPMLWNADFYQRFRQNTKAMESMIQPWAGRSDQFFATVAGCPEPVFDGVVIDGDHNTPCPQNDARNAHDRLKPDGVILLHDAIGGPVQEAALWLMDQGYRCRMYMTPHIVACCWRGDWQPPDHAPDPSINWAQVRAGHMAGFDFSRCE